MNILNTIESAAVVENAGGLYYLSFPYINDIGTTHEKLEVRVPMQHAQASTKDKQALAEAVAAQGTLGQWKIHDDGTVWLVAKA